MIHLKEQALMMYALIVKGKQTTSALTASLPYVGVVVTVPAARSDVHTVIFNNEK